jgi:hypothetical protein
MQEDKEEEEKKERAISHDDIMRVFTELYANDPSIRMRIYKKAVYLLSVISKHTQRELFYGRWLNREEMYDLLNREWLEITRLKQDMGLIQEKDKKLT